MEFTSQITNGEILFKHIMECYNSQPLASRSVSSLFPIYLVIIYAHLLKRCEKSNRRRDLRSCRTSTLTLSLNWQVKRDWHAARDLLLTALLSVPRSVKMCWFLTEETQKVSRLETKVRNPFFFFFFVKGTLAHLHVQEKGRMEHFPALRRGESVCRTLTGDTDASQHAVYTAHSNNTFINYVFILLCLCLIVSVYHLSNLKIFTRLL